MTFGEILTKYSAAVKARNFDEAAKLLKPLSKGDRKCFLDNTTPNAKKEIEARLA